MYVDISIANVIRFSTDGTVWDSQELKTNVVSVGGVFVDNTISQANPINRPTQAFINIRLANHTEIIVDLNNGVPNHPTWLPTKAGYAIAIAAIQAWHSA